MSITQITVAPGDDLYRIAAQYYGDPTAWTLIAAANPTLGFDPLIAADMTLTIPAYAPSRVNDGIPPLPSSTS